MRGEAVAERPVSERSEQERETPRPDTTGLHLPAHALLSNPGEALLKSPPLDGAPPLGRLREAWRDVTCGTLLFLLSVSPSVQQIRLEIPSVTRWRAPYFNSVVPRFGPLLS